MPKVIRNLKDNILASAKEDLFKYGFKDLNMRTIAKNNYIAVGTLYNYFPSKDMLVASIVSLDWHVTLDKLNEIAENAETVRLGLDQILDELGSFYNMYSDIFRSTGMINIRTVHADKHTMLVKTVGGSLLKLASRFDITCSDFEIEFIVDNIFNLIRYNWSKNEVLKIFGKIIK